MSIELFGTLAALAAPAPPRPPSEPGVDPLAVCTLDPAALTDRLAWIRETLLPHLAETERLLDGVALELRDVAGLAANIERWIALESDCCSGIRFERRTSRFAGRLRVEIHGVDPDRLAPLAPLTPGPVRSEKCTPSARTELAHGARAAGIGTLAALVVCCALPMTIGALGGAALAAPFARLDAPLPILATALLGSVVALAWQRRRADADPQETQTGFR